MTDPIHIAFEEDAPLTVGVEEELMLLDPETGDLAPVAPMLLDRVPDDPRYKLELPAAQFEIASPPAANAAEIASFLETARRDLLEHAAPDIALAAAGFHPFAKVEGVLNTSPRYDRTRKEYGRIARRQLVSGLQVHVAVRGSDRALAVYNAMRSYLPELTALTANAPFYGGEDSGLATVRSKVNELLPRQGVPPAIPSWRAWEEALEWGAKAGGVPEPGVWWWELRPHTAWGTLEVRVPDAQSSVADAAAVTATVHALAKWLADRHDAGEDLPVAPTWRIEENRWQALAHGVQARLANLDTGETKTASERLHELLDTITPAARELGGAEQLEWARALIDDPGYNRMRTAHAEGGMSAVIEHLISSYSVPLTGHQGQRDASATDS
jgi:carboxylate-amine ligase